LSDALDAIRQVNDRVTNLPPGLTLTNVNGAIATALEDYSTSSEISASLANIYTKTETDAQTSQQIAAFWTATNATLSQNLDSRLADLTTTAQTTTIATAITNAAIAALPPPDTTVTIPATDSPCTTTILGQLRFKEGSVQVCFNDTWTAVSSDTPDQDSEFYSCLNIKESQPNAASGTYTILRNGQNTVVYCDMETEGVVCLVPCFARPPHLTLVFWHRWWMGACRHQKVSNVQSPALLADQTRRG
jgi:hypothetical protein